MLRLDGSTGEGGGQIVRSALALSLVTGRPFRISDIRAGRERPGLLRQHLAAVRAAAAIGEASVSGARLGSRELSFAPRRLQAGDYRFAVGSAGSATLVVQTVLPALLRAVGASTVRVAGGTHNPSAPPFEFLERTYLPLIGRLGASATASLARAGFYPAGGGELEVRITAGPELEPLRLDEPGEVRRIAVEASVAALPKHIAQREVAAVSRHLPVAPRDLAVRQLPAAWGPGNVVVITIEREAVTVVFTGFGRKGVRAEQVALEAAREARGYLESGAAVSAHLADQLLLPLAIAGGGHFTATDFSRHAATNAWVVQQFLPAGIETETDARGRCRVTIVP